MDSFAQKVYDVVRRVPKGKVITYQMVAMLAGSPGAGRAVGNIMAQNPFSFGSKVPRKDRVPCHRVVKSSGELGGFMGGYEQCGDKRALLEKEGIAVKGERIQNFQQYLFEVASYVE